jgi:hypothetical protein
VKARPQPIHQGFVYLLRLHLLIAMLQQINRQSSGVIPKNIAFILQSQVIDVNYIDDEREM